MLQLFEESDPGLRGPPLDLLDRRILGVALLLPLQVHQVQRGHLVFNLEFVNLILERLQLLHQELALLHVLVALLLDLQRKLTEVPVVDDERVHRRVLERVVAVEHRRVAHVGRRVEVEQGQVRQVADDGSVLPGVLAVVVHQLVEVRGRGRGCAVEMHLVVVVVVVEGRRRQDGDLGDSGAVVQRRRQVLHQLGLGASLSFPETNRGRFNWGPESVFIIRTLKQQPLVK